MSDPTQPDGPTAARDFRPAARVLGLVSRPSRLALLLLLLGGELTPSGLAEALDLTRSDVGHQLRRMAVAGLVECVAGERLEQRRWYRLTELGRRLAEGATRVAG